MWLMMALGYGVSRAAPVAQDEDQQGEVYIS
jgi:hypothetical protein